jgi:1-acyl-sn-glycerol-3-phosphate acyltransferase
LATIYDLKPRFKALLRSLSDALVRAKLSANDVTLGALLLSAAHPKVPVVPVFMHGLGNALPRGSALLVPFNVIVSVGEPLYGKESYDAFVSELEAAMTALAAQEKLPVWSSTRFSRLADDSECHGRAWPGHDM